MADNTAKIILTARDDTKAGFDSARRNMSGLAEDAASIGGKLGVLQGAFVSLASAAAVVNLKGAIDAADQLDDLAEKTGITVEALGSLKYAGEVTGTPLEAMAKGVQKLSINMAAAAGGGKEQAAVFQALGISVKALDGSLRGSDQVLGDIADRFANFKDGPEKAALAVELFGKAGADMIPLLNQGSSGIKDLNEEASRLGVTFGGDLAASAAAFNDNLEKIRLTSQGFYTSVAGQLLPTLNELSAVFLENRDGSNGFAQSLGTGLKTILEAVTVAGANVSFVLQGIGREAGALAAQAVALGKLDLNGFKAISEAVIADGIKARAELDALENRILNVGQSLAGAGRGTATDSRSLGQVASIKEQAAAFREAAPVIKKAGEAAKKTADEFAALYARINGKATGFDADFAKNLDILKVAFDKGRLSREDYIKTVEIYKKQQPSAVAAAKAEAESIEALANANYRAGVVAREEQQGIEDWKEAQRKIYADELKTIESRIQAIQDEESAVSLAVAQNVSLAHAVEMVTLAKLEERKANLYAGTDAFNAVEKEIEARKRLLGLIDTKDLRERESAGWTSVWTSLDNTAHDVFTNVFESGSSAFKRLGQTLKASVLDLLYQMVARPFIVSVGASVLGSGFSAAANAATAGSGAAGSFASSALGSALFAGSSLAAIGSSIGTGFMATVSGQSIGAAANAYSAAGMGGTAAGLKVGAAIPYVAAALAVASAIGLFRTTKTVGSGIMGTVGEANAVTGYDLTRKSGYLFGGPDYRVKATTLDSATAKSIADAVSAVSSGSKAYAQALGLGIDALNGFSTRLGSDIINKDGGEIGIDLSGLTSDQAVAKINDELAKVGDAYAQQLIGTFQDVTTAFTQTYLEPIGDNYDGAVYVSRTQTGTTTQRTYTPSEFAKDGETAGQTLARLSTSLLGVNSLFDGMGKSMLTASLASGDISSQLLDAFGGLENASTRLNSYYSNFYTEGERTANTTRLLTASLADLGQALPASRDAFRAIVDAQDLTSESGRATYASLISLSDAFASITPAAQSAGSAAGSIVKTLDQIATERTGLEDTLLNLLGETATLRQRELAALDPSNRALATMVSTVQDAQSAIGTLTSDIARLDAIATQANGLSATISQALGGADNSAQGLWAAVNSTTATAETRLSAVAELITVINGSIATDTAAAQQTLTDGANAAQKAIEQTNAAQLSALQNQLTAAERLRDTGRQLRDYVQDIRLGSSSTLTPAQKLAFASAQYSASLAGAQAGDVIAASSLQSNASAYLEQARSYDPASYVEVFSAVTNTLDGLGTSLMSEGASAAATAAAQLTSLQAISAATTSASAEAFTGNVISTANRAALESLLDVTTQIEAQATIDRANAQAQITAENARMEAIRASLSDAGLLASTATSTNATLTALAAQQGADNASLLAEIRALNQRIAALESTLVQATSAQITTAVTVGNQTAAALADGLSGASYSASNVPVVA